ncbi:MAG: hypothetical protein K8H90_04215, partial [Thermoanaerobaculia bacterium]|nr:hypothetical protein [Thermoanaerobaculia bacterium]
MLALRWGGAGSERNRVMGFDAVTVIGLGVAAALLLPRAAIAQDPDEIFIGDGTTGVVVHDFTLTGDVPPLRHLDGGSTGFTASTYAVAVDERRREIYVPVAT